MGSGTSKGGRRSIVGNNVSGIQLAFVTVLCVLSIVTARVSFAAEAFTSTTFTYTYGGTFAISRQFQDAQAVSSIFTKSKPGGNYTDNLLSKKFIGCPIDQKDRNYNTKYIACGAGTIDTKLSGSWRTGPAPTHTWQQAIQGARWCIEKQCPGETNTGYEFYDVSLGDVILTGECNSTGYYLDDARALCVDQLPEFTASTSAPTSAREGQVYTATFSVYDADVTPNFDLLTLQHIGVPTWAKPTTGTSTLTITGTPGADADVSNSIQVTVTDRAGKSATKSYTLNVNLRPTISGAPATSVVAGMSYDSAVTVGDRNNDIQSVALTNAPSWLVVSNTGRLTGTPPLSEGGVSYTNIGVTVTDVGGLSQTLTYNLAVDTNFPPTAAIILDGGAALVGEVVPVDASGSQDANNTALTYTYSFGDGTLLTSNSALETHRYTKIGNYTVAVSVSDGLNTPVTATSAPIEIYEALSCDDNGSNPISDSTGAKSETETDYVGAGSWPLVLTRFYNSKMEAAPAAADPKLGGYWRHSYARALVRNGAVVRLYRADGMMIPFSYRAKTNKWTAAGALGIALEETTGGWKYTDTDNTVETYNTAGKLLAITNLAGQSITLSYYPAGNAAGNLYQAVDPFGRTLTFNYNAASGLLESVTDPTTNQLIQYGYELASDAVNHLKTVTYQNLTQRTYLYTAAGFAQAAHALTGIMDENNIQYAEFRYDVLGRAYYSSHAGNADAVTFQYIDDTLTLITDALDQTREFRHDATGGMHRTSSQQSLCTTCRDSFKSATFDANGNPDVRTDFRSNVTDYDYDTRGLEIKRTEALVRDANGVLQPTLLTRSIVTEWNATYRLPECVIEPQRTIDFVYAANGQLQSRTEIDTSDATKFATADVKTCAQIAARADYAQLNKRTWSYAYYPAGVMQGLVQTIDGPRTDVSDVTTYAYDAVTGNLATITNPLLHVTHFLSYDAHGRSTTIQDPNGLVTKLEYDLRGRLRFRREGTDVAGFEVTEYQYDNAGNLDKLILPNSAFLDYGYDAAHRLTDIRDQLNNHIHYTLDGLGNRTQIDTYDPAGTLRRAHTNHYWPSNQLKDSADAANPSQGVAPGVTKYMKPDGSEGYDANGNRTQVQDAQSQLTQVGYDAYNRVEQVTDAKQGVAKYRYDANHRIKTVTDPNNVVTTYTYDGLGNVTSIQSADVGLIQFTAYDAAGNLLGRLDRTRVLVATYAYDALNRVDLATYIYDNRTTADYVYDTGANAIGRLTSITDSSGSTSYGYDLHGRVSSKTQTVGTVALTMGYSYDAQGQLDTLTYPSGKTVKYSYLYGVTNALNVVGGATLLNNMSYEPFGPLSAWSFGNGQAVSRQYDQDGRMRSYTLGSGSRTLDYYPSGNVYHVLDPANAANNQTYGYDELYRLTRYQGLGDTLGYGYDANGNRSSTTVNGQAYPSLVEDLSNRLKDVTGPVPKIYLYDRGYLFTDGSHMFGYDNRGRLTNIDRQTTYAINTLGLRVQKVVNLFTQPGDANGDGVLDALDRALIANLILGLRTVAPGKPDCNGDDKITVQDLVCLNAAINGGGTINGTRLFAYDEAGHLRGEYDANGIAIQEYVWFGEQPLAVLKGTAVFNVYTDHLNTPRLIADQTNKTVWTWNSDPFGTAIADEDADGDGVRFNFNLRFPGQYYDAESGLHYNVHRTYDPQTGRYLESDPVGLRGGLNPYSYVNNNTLKDVDPLGLQGGPVNLGGDYSGRVDQFNVGGSSSFEVHVYDSTGREVGVYGPEGWINKHGKGVPTNLPPTLENTLKGISIDELRARGTILPKGQADITGEKWKTFARNAKKACKVLGPLSVITSIGIDIGTGQPINPGEILCDAVWGCRGPE